MSEEGGEKPEGEGEGEPVIEYPDPRFNLTHEIIQRGLQQLYRVPSKLKLFFSHSFSNC